MTHQEPHLFTPTVLHATLPTPAHTPRATYTGTEERTVRGQRDTDKHSQTTQSAWRRFLRHAHTRGTRLHGVISLLFFAILAVLAATLLTVTWQLTFQPVSRALRDAHNVHILGIKARAEYGAVSLVRLVKPLASMWMAVPTMVNPVTMSEAQLCNAVDNAMSNIVYTKGVALISQSLDEGRTCYKSFDLETGESTLSEIHTENGEYVGGALRVSLENHRYVQPLQVVYPIAPNALSVSEYFALNPKIRQLLDEYKAYRSGENITPTARLRWSAVKTKPTYMVYTYPVPAYDTQKALDAGEPDGRAILQGRLDFQRFFREMAYTEATRAVLLDERGIRTGYTDPYLVAASWMPRVTNNTDVWANRNSTELYYARVSNIDDAVMRAGLQHVRMHDFNRGVAFDSHKTFWHNGAQAVVSWGNYTTDDGLSLAYVVVDVGGPVRGMVEAKCVVIACSVAFLVLLLPLVFSAVLDELFGHPLRAISHSLNRAGRLGNKKGRRHVSDDARIVIREVDELVDAHNDAVDVLRAVEAHLPAALFGDGESSDDLGASTTGSSVVNSSCTLTTCGTSALFDGTSREARGLTTMRMSVVALRPVARTTSTDVDNPETGGREGDSTGEEDRPMMRGLEALRVLDRETYNAPGPAFRDRWAVQDYATAVLQAAERHSGTVLYLAPDAVVVCFGATMETLTRGNTAAELAAALEARAVAADALSATLFARDVRSQLDQLAARDASCVPDVTALVETNTYHVGVQHVAALQQSLSVAVGRTVRQYIHSVPLGMGGCVLASAVAAQTLVSRLRTVPWCVLHVRARHGGVTQYAAEVLNEVLDGRPDTPSWRAQYELLVRAVECLYRSDYRSALFHLQRIPAAARGDTTLMSGARLGAVMQAAADTGVASAQLYGSVQSTVLLQLFAYCEAHLRHPRVANTVLAPTSYADLLARALPPLAATPVTDGATDSVTSTCSVTCPSLAGTVRGETATGAPLASSAQTVRMTGVNGQTWLMPLDVADVANEALAARRPLTVGSMVLSTTGSVSQADELLFEPGALTRYTADQLRRFVDVPDCTYLACVEDLVVEEGGERGAVIYEFTASPTVAMHRAMFPHAFPVPLSCRHAFCAMAALACLDAEGLVHARVSPSSLLLLPGGMTKVKTLGGALEDSLGCFGRAPSYYVSPEEAAGGLPTIVSNVYSLAVVVVEFLARKLPYRWTAAAAAAADRVADDVVKLQEQCGAEFTVALADGLLEVIDIPDEVGVPAGMLCILRACLQRDARLRPRPRDALRMFRADKHLGELVRDYPSGPWEDTTAGVRGAAANTKARR